MGLSSCQFSASQPAGAAQISATRTPFQAISATAALPAAGLATPAVPTAVLPTADLPTAVILTAEVPGVDPTAAETPPASTPQPAPTLTLPALPAQCVGQPGRVEEKETAFMPGAEAFHFRVYLPPCFDSNAAAAYPVLYLIHGQTFSDDQWVRLGIAEAADALIGGQKAPPFIIVMPREPDTFADIYLSSFYNDVTNHLVTWIDNQYPTCARRECRAIGGLSRGGAWAVYLGFTRWDLFGAVGAHSTPPFNTTPRDFPGWVQQIPAGSMPRVYMDIGRGDPYLSQASALAEQMVALGVPHEWYVFNGTHNEEYWAGHAADYLAWYAQGWQTP